MYEIFLILNFRMRRNYFNNNYAYKEDEALNTKCLQPEPSSMYYDYNNLKTKNPFIYLFRQSESIYKRL